MLAGKSADFFKQIMGERLECIDGHICESCTFGRRKCKRSALFMARKYTALLTGGLMRFRNHLDVVDDWLTKSIISKAEELGIDMGVYANEVLKNVIGIRANLRYKR